MRLLKRFFFVGTCTSGTVIFLYKTIRPDDIPIDNFLSFLLYLILHAFFFLIIGATILLYDYAIKKYINYEDDLRHNDKSH